MVNGERSGGGDNLVNMFRYLLVVGGVQMFGSVDDIMSLFGKKKDGAPIPEERADAYREIAGTLGIPREDERRRGQGPDSTLIREVD